MKPAMTMALAATASALVNGFGTRSGIRLSGRDPTSRRDPDVMRAAWE